MAKYEQMYSQLNPAQKQAVDQIDGPVMVIAGPGTGKTQVLAVRIARILDKTDTPPESILALTFTESAAENMRQRLVQMIGRTGYYVTITTFHAFCSQVIQSNPDYFPLDRSALVLSELERFKLFEDIILELDLAELKSSRQPLYYLRDIIRAISDLKREGVSVDDFEKIIEDKQIEIPTLDLPKTKLNKALKNLHKQQDLVSLYRVYQHRLLSMHRYDYDDMIQMVSDAFATHPDLLSEYQEQYLYFLADEYQDTNSAQNKILSHLTSYWRELGDPANVFVVGDPNQAIYRFQGASVENALGFIDEYPEALVVSLVSGYRCPQPIYDVSFELISHNELQIEDERVASGFRNKLDSKSKSSKSSLNESLQLIEVPNQMAEMMWLATKIKSLKASGTNLSDVAILARNNRDLAELNDFLTKQNVPVAFEGGISVLDHPQVVKLVEIIKVVHLVGQGELPDTIFEVMNYVWFNLSPELVIKLTRAAGDNRLQLLETIEQVLNGKLDLEFGEEKTTQLKEFYDLLLGWFQLSTQQTLSSFMEKLFADLKLFEWAATQQDYQQLLLVFQSFFKQAQRMEISQTTFSIADFIQALELMQSYNLDIPVEDVMPQRDAVRLSTVHKAKGQEWDEVFIVHAWDKKWGNGRNVNLVPLPEEILSHTDQSKKEKNEDERRLFYVALTRAKKRCWVSYSNQLIDGQREQTKVRTMFMEEFGLDVNEYVDRPDFDQQQVEQAIINLMTPEKLAIPSQIIREVLSGYVQEFRLSVSALNTYLRDPNEFMIKYLLKVPRAIPDSLSFGTAIHASMEFLAKQWLKTKQQLTVEDLIVIFDKAMDQQAMTKEAKERRRKQGHLVLKQYLDNFSYQNFDPLFIERFFGTELNQSRMGEVRLSGRVDRIDLLDKVSKQVKVIDYKTGRSKTDGEIEATRKSAYLSPREQELPEPIRGAMKRQLLFYKLLADLDVTFKYKVTVGEFEFVEPNNSGKIVTRNYSLTDEDVELLKDLIITVYTEIKELKFLDEITTSNLE